MFAIVTIAGQQFKVSEGQELFVHRLEAEEGASIKFDQVHLVDNNGSISVGTPIVKGASIGATVITPLVKGDKVIVFKKKRRKGYRVKNGHRQHFSKIKINSIAL
jgi:large subunit ribosomal protein L21